MALPPLIAVITANIAQFEAAMATVKGEAVAASGMSSTAFTGMAALGKVAFLGMGAAAIAGGAVALKMGADFQESMTQLVTGAGESRANIELVSQGILHMAGEVGASADKLAQGMYMIESAGFHGADGLKVLEAAAEGAKVGNAEMATVADAVTSALNAYHLSGNQAADVTNNLVAAVGQGKMHMEDLAGALGKVVPVAATAHISLAEVTGAIATMTSMGLPAAKAATFLNQTIAQLENPTAKATKEMQALGLSAIDISQHLGERGLAATFTILTNAIQSKMGPAGTVLLDHLKKMAGSTTDFEKVLGDLPPTQQTYIAALANMVGGTKSMQAALMLTGDNAKTFQGNVAAINEKVAEGGGKIRGWAEVQADFNQRIARGVEGLKAWATEVGLKLIPIAEHAMDTVAAMVGWFKAHEGVTRMVAAAIAGPLLVAIGLYTISMAEAAIATIVATWPLLLIVAAIAAVAAGLMWAYDNITPFHDAVNAIIPTLGNAARVFGEVAGSVVQFIGKAIDWLKTNWPIVVTIVLGPLGLIIALVTGHGDQLKQVFMGAWNAVMKWLGAALPQLPRLFGQAVGWVIGELFLLNILLIDWAVKTIPGFIATVFVFMATLPLRMSEVLLKVLDVFHGWIVDLANWIVSPTGLIKFMEAFNTEMGKLPGQMLDIGVKIVQGIWAGISSADKWFKDQIESFTRGIADGITKAIKGGSPAMLFAPHGEMIDMGIAYGLQRSNATASALSGRMASLAGVGAPATTSLAGSGRGATGGDGGLTVQVIVQGSILTPSGLAESLEQPIRALMLRFARNNVNVGLA